jgi:hypothetical protein
VDRPPAPEPSSACRTSGTLTFTSCLIDGKALASRHPGEYLRVNHAGIVQIAPGALSPAGTAFATYNNRS